MWRWFERLLGGGGRDDASGAPPANDDTIVPAAEFPSPFEAQAVCDLLEEHGIRASMSTPNASTYGLSRSEVYVFRRDLARARDLLTNGVPIDDPPTSD